MPPAAAPSIGRRRGPTLRPPWDVLPAALALLLLAGSVAAAAAPAGYALVVNGDRSFTHQRNVEMALEALTAVGYPAANVLLLAAPDAPTAGVVPGYRGAPTKAGWKEAVALLGRRLEAEDTLLVYLTGHADRRGGKTLLILQHGFLTEKLLATSIAGLPFSHLLLIADPCYSGGFAEALADEHRPLVMVTATDRFHETRCEPFIRPFWAAATDPGSDADGDGRVSVGEAFAVASELVRGGAGRWSEAAPRLSVRAWDLADGVPFLPTPPPPTAPHGNAAGGHR